MSWCIDVASVWSMVKCAKTDSTDRLRRQTNACMQHRLDPSLLETFSVCVAKIFATFRYQQLASNFRETTQTPPDHNG